MALKSLAFAYVLTVPVLLAQLLFSKQRYFALCAA